MDCQALPPLYLLVQIAEEQGDCKQAKALLKKIIYLHPDAVAAYIELGELYQREQQADQARRMFKSAHLLLQAMAPNTELEYPGQITAKKLLQHVE